MRDLKKTKGQILYVSALDYLDLIESFYMAGKAKILGHSYMGTTYYAMFNFQVETGVGGFEPALATQNMFQMLKFHVNRARQKLEIMDLEGFVTQLGHLDMTFEYWGNNTWLEGTIRDVRMWLSLIHI